MLSVIHWWDWRNSYTRDDQPLYSYAQMKGLVLFEKPKLQCSVFGIETQLLGFIEWAFWIYFISRFDKMNLLRYTDRLLMYSS